MNNRTQIAKLLLVVMMLVGLTFIALVSIGNLKKMGKYKGNGLAIELGTSLVDMYDESLADLKIEEQEKIKKEILVTPVIAVERKPVKILRREALATPVKAVKIKVNKNLKSSRLVVAEDGTTYRLVKIVRKKQKVEKVQKVKRIEKVVNKTQVVNDKKEIK